MTPPACDRCGHMHRGDCPETVTVKNGGVTWTDTSKVTRAEFDALCYGQEALARFLWAAHGADALGEVSKADPQAWQAVRNLAEGKPA